MRNKILVLALLALTSCSYLEKFTTPLNAQYPDMPTDVAGVELTLTAVETIAFAYVNQPLCGAPKATKICSNINVVRNIGKAQDSAEAALKLAKESQNATAIGAAINAVGAFRQIVLVISPSKG